MYIYNNKKLMINFKKKFIKVVRLILNNISLSRKKVIIKLAL